MTYTLTSNNFSYVVCPKIGKSRFNTRKQMKLTEWVESDCHWHKKGVSSVIKIKELFAELIAVNGGQLVVRQIGVVRPEVAHPYGRLGLEMQEALLLVKFAGIMEGLLLGLDDLVERDKQTAAFNKLIQDQINLVKQSPQGSIQIYPEGILKAIDKKTGGNGKDIIV